MPVYLQIAKAIIHEISQGRIAAGTRLPSSRKMAELLGVNRRTVVAAYDELTAQDWLTSKTTSGTFVNEHLPTVSPVALAETPSVALPQLKKSSLAKPYKRRFDDGHPDVRLAPMQALSRAYSGLLRNTRFLNNLDYNDEFAGDPMLRLQLALHLRDTRGIYVDVDQILVTRGSIMAFYLLMESMLKPEDCVVVGKPGYGTFNKIVEQKGGHLRHVDVDEQGMLVDQVAAICEQRPVSFVYVVPHHHHPTTVTLSPERRIRLLELAQQYDFYIIEDDYDYDFHYESSPILPLASLQHGGQVMYVGSFSKSIAPALRLGFLVGDAHVVSRLAGLRRFIDRTGDPLLERAVSHLLKHGEIRRHLQKSLRAYRARRNTLCDIVRQELNGMVQINPPEGGMAAWTHFHEDIDLDKSWDAFGAAGLSVNRPEEYGSPGSRSTRLGFASLNEDEIAEALQMLKRGLRY
ncbi:MAG: PLP-dependent aminotransferase family protein [Bacteroidia bacterium]